MGVVTSDEDLVEKVLNSLPKSWSIFRQIQRGRDMPLLFFELEGLLLHEEVTRNQGCHTGRPKAFWRAYQVGGLVHYALYELGEVL
jgi:hypothetical protein